MLYLDGLRDYQEGFVATLDEAASTREGVEGAVHDHLAWIANHRELAVVLLLERDARVLTASTDALRILNVRFFRAVRDWTAPRTRAGELRDLESEVLTALWIGPSQELARHWLADPSRISLTMPPRTWPAQRGRPTSGAGSAASSAPSRLITRTDRAFIAAVNGPAPESGSPSRSHVT